MGIRGKVGIVASAPSPKIAATEGIGAFVPSMPPVPSWPGVPCTAADNWRGSGGDCGDGGTRTGLWATGAGLKSTLRGGSA